MKSYRLLVWGADHGKQSADHFDAQHHLFNLLFDNKLIHRLMDGVNCVLDLGYGAANWAIQVAENYPNAQVKC